MPKPNTRLKSRREGIPLSQAELAEQVGVTEGTVRRWEAGLRPQPAHVRRLCTVLDASPDALGFGPRGDSRSDRAAPENRPQAIRPGGELVGTAVTEAHLESLELDRQVEVSELGPTTLRQLELTVERFGLEYLHAPPLGMFDAVRSCRRYVVDLLNARHTLAERARLYGVGGWLSALLGHLSFDLGEEPWVSHSHCATALHLAAETDLHELTTWTRGTQAMIAVFDGHPEEAVKVSQAGLQVAPEGSAAAVRLWAQQARAHARMGERANVERAMAAAERVFGELVQKPTHSIFSFDAPYLPFYEGTAYVWLEEPELAQESAERAITLCDRAPADWPVARVMARIDLATSFVQQGELEGASRIASEALRICASGRRTNPIAKRFAELVESFDEPSLSRDLEDQYRALLPARNDA